LKYKQNFAFSLKHIILSIIQQKIYYRYILQKNARFMESTIFPLFRLTSKRQK